MQDYVCCAVQIESGLVGRELVAGQPVGLESVHEFGNHLLHVSSVAIAFRVYEAVPLPLEVRHDKACRSRRHPQSRLLSGISSGGASRSGCATIGSRRRSLIQDSMRSMMQFDDFSYPRTRGSPPSEESSGAEKSTVTF